MEITHAKWEQPFFLLDFVLMGIIILHIQNCYW